MNDKGKRFFELSQNGGEPFYWICAIDQPTAPATLDASGIDLDLDASGQPTVWRELTSDEAGKLNCDTSEDERGRGVIPLTECDLGEWFSSEW